MSPYLEIFFEKIWAWLIVPPLNWALSLSLEAQLELGGFVILGIFHRRIMEHYVLGKEAIGAWWAERRSLHEWYYYGSMKEPEFRRRMESLQRQADRQEQLAERLLEKDYRGFRGEILRRAAEQRLLKAEQLREDVLRLERLWTAIETERGGPGDKTGMRKKVLGLMRKLDSRYYAQEALAELSRIGAWFDWEVLAPAGLPESQREQLVQSLSRMAQAASIAEARSAYSAARRLLEQHNREWEWDRDAVSGTASN